MNPDTGKIKEFKPEGFEQALNEGWIEWKLNEEVEVKGCRFRVIRISCARNVIELKGIGKTEVK